MSYVKNPHSVEVGDLSALRGLSGHVYIMLTINEEEEEEMREGEGR